jgi:hypothetical protein
MKSNEYKYIYIDIKYINGTLVGSDMNGIAMGLLGIGAIAMGLPSGNVTVCYGIYD